MHTGRKKGTFWLMITVVILFRAKWKIITHFSRLHKDKYSKNSTKSPFWWHNKKDEVYSIYLMGIIHFLLFYFWHQLCWFCIFRSTRSCIFLVLCGFSYNEPLQLKHEFLCKLWMNNFISSPAEVKTCQEIKLLVP